MTGLGDSKEKANEDLRKRLKEYLEQNGTLPRPGTKVPIQFASTEEIDKFSDIADDFLNRVLDCNGAFISDRSSLCDFHSEVTIDACLEKIKQIYGIDVSDIEGGFLLKIFKRIAEQKQC